MNRHLNLIIASALITMSALMFVGCAESGDLARKDKTNVDGTGTPSEQTDELSDSEADAKRLLDKKLALLSSGGQPGDITLRGVIVTKSDDGELILDSHIKAVQIGGENLEGVAVQADEELKLVLTNEMTESQIALLTPRKTFINMGCEVSSEDTADLEDISKATLDDVRQDAVKNTSVGKMFICGEQQIPYVSGTFNVSELILKDANLSIYADGMGGALTLSARILKLEGVNKISTTGTDSSGDVVFKAQDINLAVAEQLQGDGSLVVESKGGRRVQSGTLSDDQNIVSTQPVGSAAQTKNSTGSKATSLDGN